MTARAMGPLALGPRALGHWAPGPRALGPRALGLLAQGPFDLVRRALGPRALGIRALGPELWDPWLRGDELWGLWLWGYGLLYPRAPVPLAIGPRTQQLTHFASQLHRFPKMLFACGGLVFIVGPPLPTHDPTIANVCFKMTLFS